MANPRVLAVTADQSGCTLYRVWMPFTQLRARGWQAGWIPVDRLEEAHLRQADIVVLPRIGGKLARIERFLKDVRKSGARLVYEVDDDLWGTTEDNPAHEGLQEGAAGMQYLLAHCDAVTVTNEHLAHRVQQLAGWPIPSFVIPNHVDRRVWDQVRKEKLARKITALTVGVHGGNSHQKDWAVLAQAWPLVARRYPEVHFIAAGFCPPELDVAMKAYPNRCIYLPFTSLDRYPLLIRQIDIACCPLRDTTFNKSKSDIKFLESTMAGGVAVCSPTVYGTTLDQIHGASYIHPDSNDDPETWAGMIGDYIEEATLRRHDGKRYRRWVLEHREIQAGARLWEQAYLQVMAL